MKDDIYTFFAAGLYEDIRHQIMGAPTPPVTLDTLLNASGNAELERKKAK